MPTNDVLSTWFIVLLKLPSPVKMAIFIGLSKIELAVKTAFRECVFYSDFTHHMAAAVIILLLKFSLMTRT